MSIIATDTLRAIPGQIYTRPKKGSCTLSKYWGVGGSLLIPALSGLGYVMLVKDCMTPSPITVRPESDPLIARELLEFGGFRRLPVTDERCKLIGIVTQNDLDVFLSQAKSPGVLKRQHRIAQLMNCNVITISPDCPLEEAASLMIAHKIGCVPVVENERVVGIITETDIFSQLTSALGAQSESIRLTVQVPNTPGQLAELTHRIAQVNGNISSVIACPTEQQDRTNITLRIEQIDQETLLHAISEQPELEILHIWPKGKA